MVRYSHFVLALFYVAVVVVSALPTVRKESEVSKKSAKTDEANSALEAELGKLKQDGVAVEKTDHIVSETVNGKTQTRKTEKETVTDAKSGHVVASASKTVTKDDSGSHKGEVHIDVPAAGIHEAFNGADAENFELLPSDEVARYIFDTSDIDGVKAAVQALVDNKKITKKAADSYVQEIREQLNTLHEEALNEMTAELEQRRKDEDAVYKDMLSMVQVLNDNSETEKALYAYAKKLYEAYRKEGDEYARELLNQFTSVLQQETESGNVDESVQDNIYDIILQALKDVTEGTQSDPSSESENTAGGNDEAASSEEGETVKNGPKD